MVRWPWQNEGEAVEQDPRSGVDAEPAIVCSFQDGTIYVYDDHVFIERAGPSKFEDKAIDREDLVGVNYSKGIAIGYLQLEQIGFENATGGFLTSPVDENTLHFGRGDRDCAERVREELLFESQPP